jgi:hypothetical protein
MHLLPYLGIEGVGTREIDKLRDSLSPAEKRKLVERRSVWRGLDLQSSETDRGEGGLNEIAQMAAEARADFLQSGCPLPLLGEFLTSLNFLADGCETSPPKDGPNGRKHGLIRPLNLHTRKRCD